MLTLGDGSWRTKPLANKVCSIREQVEPGLVIVSYVNTTTEQCADALTKFVRGGPQQISARKYLSLCVADPPSNNCGRVAAASCLSAESLNGACSSLVSDCRISRFSMPEFSDYPESCSGSVLKIYFS